ncbi:MAG TPA: TIGR03435 family protein [Blastocatellia bacterium]
MQRVAACFLFAASLLAQAPAHIPADLRFEVASLKPGNGKEQSYGIRPAPGGQRYEAWNCPISVMIQTGYYVKAEQIVGGPSWVNTEPFDMDAKAEKPSSIDELHVMLMNMLADRLHLASHREKREMPIYALTVNKGGAKLKPHQAANGGEPWIEQTSKKFLHIRMAATAATLDYLGYRLSRIMDRPVVNLTNLPGGYDFNLEYTQELPLGFPPGGKINGEEPDTSGPTVFDALKQQLGLELKAQKGLAEVIVIDHLERPTEN